MHATRPIRFSIICALGAAGCHGSLDEPGAGSHQTRAALIVARSATCSVALDQVSYDDPGADDAEVIQLVVTRAVTHPSADGASAPSGGGSGADGGSAGSGLAQAPPDAVSCGADAGVSSPRDAAATRGPTLGDCGLESLDLLNGGVEGCPVYRSIDLTDVAIPDDGFVVLCSEDSTLAGSSGCDVTHAGTRKLPNGWIQNGPADGLRFVATDGAAVEIGYEGAESVCFGGQGALLHEEAGQAADGADDVNVACDGSFTLVSAIEAPLRTPRLCASGGGDGSAFAARDAAAAPSEPDGTPAPEAFPTGSITGETSTVMATPLAPRADAGADPEDSTPLEQPPSVGCSVGPRGHGGAYALAAIALVLGSLAGRGRRAR